MIPEEKIEVITDFINHFICELDQEILDKLEVNFNQGKELLQDYEKEEVERIFYTKHRLENWLIEDEDLYSYVYEEE